MFCTIESNPSLSLDTNSSVEYSIHSWRGQGTQCGVQSHAGQCVEVTSMANRLTRLPKNAKWCPGACSNCIQENVQQKLKKCKVMPRCWLQYAVNAGEGEKKKEKRLAKSKDDHRVDGNAPRLTLPFRSWAIPYGAPSPGFSIKPITICKYTEVSPNPSNYHYCAEKTAAIPIISFAASLWLAPQESNCCFLYPAKVAGEPKMHLFLLLLTATAPPITTFSYRY